VSFRDFMVLTRPEYLPKLLDEIKASKVSTRQLENNLNYFILQKSDGPQIAFLSFEDAGGINYFLASSLRKLGYRALSLRCRDNYIRYPTDIDIFHSDTLEQKIRSEAAENYVLQSDVVVIDTTFGIPPSGAYFFNINRNKILNDFPDEKIVVFYHKGTTYRLNFPQMDEVIDRFPCKTLRLVSTIDLLQCNEKNRWLPNPIDVEWILKHFPRREKEDDVIRIVHSPTHRHNFGTNAIIKTVKKLQEKYKNVQLLLVERVSWYQSLFIKSAADIVVGRVNHSLPAADNKIYMDYSLAALEAGVYSLPCINNVPQQNLEYLRKHENIDKLPIVLADEKSLFKALEYLIEDEKARKEYGAALHKYVLKVHNAPVTARRFIRYIEEVL